MANGHGGARVGAGRPKGSRIDPDIVRLCRTSAPEIALRLIDMALGHIDGVDHNTQVKAAQVVLDRGLGKPIQPTDITTNGESIGFQPIVNIINKSIDPRPVGSTIVAQATAGTLQHRQ